MSDPGEGQEPGQEQGGGQGSQAEGVSRAEFEGLSGKVDQILAKLGSGGTPAKDGGQVPPGKSVAEQVREGIEELKRKEAAEKAAADKDAAIDARLKRIEQPPGPAETWRGRMQRRLYGTEPDGRRAERVS